MKKNNVLIKNIADLQDSFFCKQESHKSLCKTVIRYEFNGTAS
jgi:hypothetical protein